MAYTFPNLLQYVRSWLHVPARFRQESKLWLHQFRYLWLGISVSLQANDTRLLGEPLPTGKITEQFSHQTCLILLPFQLPYLHIFQKSYMSLT